jgi:signal transduction histidine kinase
MNSKNQVWRKWAGIFWNFAGAVSVRTKMVGIILGLVLILGMGITLVVRQTLQRAMLHELELRAISVTHDLANRSTDLILINNLYALHQLIHATQANHADIRYIFIVDEEGYVLAHTFGDGFPAGLTQANSINSVDNYTSRILDTTEGPVLDVAVPVFEGRAGIARIGFSDLLVRRTVSGVTSQILLATLLVSTAGVMAAIGMTWLLTRPILQLAEAARAVGHGDLKQRVPRWADDELGELAEAFNIMVSDLEKAAVERNERERLRVELIERVISAQEEERNRIARDLHDQTSQSLVSLIVQLKLVEAAGDEEDRKQRLAELRDQLRTVLGDVRRMALDLRPGVLDDLGLVEAIHWFAERCCQNGEIKIHVTACDPCNFLPTKESVALYRVAQEAMSNIIKHSRARQAWVKLYCEDNQVFLEVQDDGIGFNGYIDGKRTGGMGLFSMEERMQILGGKLEIESRAGIGSCIRAILPYPEQKSVIKEGQ